MKADKKTAGGRICYVLAGLAAAVLCLGIAFGVYVNMDYPALEEVGLLLEQPGTEYLEEERAYQVFPQEELPVQGAALTAEDSGISDPKEASVGIIFYPGAKVQETAYLPLLKLLAEKGIYCFCVRMPFQMAVFDSGAAEKLIDAHPEIDKWYLMGHSLGGAMAAGYAQKNSDHLEGLILLGAYAAGDLSKTQLRVLSIYGSEDQVLNREKYEKYRTNLPSGYQELVIEGGNHAQFGVYGEQKGDGTAFISPEDQLKATAEAVFDFLEENQRSGKR